MPFNIGAPELIVILVIALLVIGPGKLPDVGSALGKSIREFRKASSDVQDATRVDTSPVPPASAAQPTSQPPSSEPTTESNR
jgi:sec-independent protein translocase protein TatA